MRITSLPWVAAAIAISSTTLMSTTPAGNAATSLNQLGIALLGSTPTAATTSDNLLLSPYSIQSALGLAFVGADGKTREEMRRVMHLPADDTVALAGFAALERELDALVLRTKQGAERMKQYGGSQEAIEFSVANRAYFQRGYPIHADYLATLRDTFHSDAPELDFHGASESARAGINQWVAAQTRDKIRDLIPRGGVGPATRAVLVNALYLRAPWQNPFYERNTKPAPFWVRGTESHDLPVMAQTTHCGYAEHADHVAVSLPYVGDDLHFLVLLPRERNGLPALLRSLTAEKLAASARLPSGEVILRLPKFKIPGATLPLGRALTNLGMPTAFDQPPGSANFARLAARRPDDYLFVSEVYHQTFLALDERGTEAAAATAVALAAGAAFREKPKPVEVRVDHPFVLAIQHAPTGACLFLGWVNDPR